MQHYPLLRLANKPGVIGLVTATIGEVGGSIGAIDIVEAGFDVVRDITVAAGNELHAQAIVDAVKVLPGVTFIHVSDLVFLVPLAQNGAPARPGGRSSLRMIRFSCPILTAMALATPLQAAPPGMETHLIDPALLGFGPPGFSTVVTVSEGMDFDDGSGSVDYLDGRARVPWWGKEISEGNFVGTSLGYGWASLDVNGALGVEQLTLSTVELQLTAAHFPKGPEGWMGLGIVSGGLSSDFIEVSSDAFSFTAIGVWGYQFSPRFTLSAAGVYAHSIGEDLLLPGVGLVWRPSDALTVQLTPPIAALGWTPNESWTLSLSAYPAGGAWGVGEKSTERKVEAVKLESWRTGLGVERRMGDHLHFAVQAGMNFGGELELRDSGQRVLLGKELDASFFCLLGVAWTF